MASKSGFQVVDVDAWSLQYLCILYFWCQSVWESLIQFSSIGKCSHEISCLYTLIRVKLGWSLVISVVCVCVCGGGGGVFVIVSHSTTNCWVHAVCHMLKLHGTSSHISVEYFQVCGSLVAICKTTFRNHGVHNLHILKNSHLYYPN